MLSDVHLTEAHRALPYARRKLANSTSMLSRILEHEGVVEHSVKALNEGLIGLVQWNIHVVNAFSMFLTPNRTHTSFVSC